MSGLPPDLPRNGPINPSAGTIMPFQSTASNAAVGPGSIAVPHGRPGGVYHPQPPAGERLVGNNTRANSSASAAASPSYHHFGGGFLNVNGAAAPQPQPTPGSMPHVNDRASPPSITQAVAQSVLYGGIPRGSMGFPRTSQVALPPQRVSPVMLSAATPPQPPPGAAAIAAYRPFAQQSGVMPQAPGPGNTGGGVGAATQPTPVLPQPSVAAPHMSTGGFSGTSGGASSAAATTAAMPQGNNAPTVSPHHQVVFPPQSPQSSLQQAAPGAQPPTKPVPSAVRVDAGSVGSAVASPAAPASAAVPSSAAASGEVVVAPVKTGLAALVEKKVGDQGGGDEADMGQKMQPPPPRKRWAYTLLPPGYLESRGGKVQKASTSGITPKSEEKKGGDLSAALNAGTPVKAKQGPGRWLLSEDQVFSDIMSMKVDLPKGVVIKSEKKKQPEAQEEAEVHPQLTPSEKEWLMIAREEEEAEKKASAENEKPAGNDADQPTDDAGKPADKAATGKSAVGKGKGKLSSGSSKEAATAVVSAAAGKDADGGSGSSKVAAADGGEGGGEGVDGASGNGVGEGAEVKDGEPPVMSMTRRELVEWDAQRDALELKEIMIRERTRERRKSMVKERARAHAVIQFLTKLDREERGRANLLRAKGRMLADMAKMLPERLAETENLRQQIRVLKGGAAPPGPAPEPQEPLADLISSSAAGSKGKGKARGSLEAMVVVGEDGEKPPSPADAKSKTGCGAAVAVPASATASSGDPPNVHSMTGGAMLKFWDALGERVLAARKVVREVGIEAEALPPGSLGGAGGGLEEGRLRGGRGRGGGGGGTRGRSRKGDAMETDDYGPAGAGDSVQSSLSSGDESEECSALSRGHGGRFRKRKLARMSGAANVAASATPPRKQRGRRAQGAAGAAGSGDTVHRERLDWYSTVTRRTPYGIPLLLSCLSAYPDKVAAAFHPSPNAKDAEPLPGAGGGGGDARELTANLLPGFRRAEVLREANLEDRARAEQAEAVYRIYAEASKSVTEPRATSPKLKGAFRAERQEEEKEMWRQELEELEEAVARAMPPPPVDTQKDSAKGKGKPKGRRGATVATRGYVKDAPSATTTASGTSVHEGSTSTPPAAASAPPTTSPPPRSLPRAAKPPSGNAGSAAKHAAMGKAGSVSGAATIVTGRGGKEGASAPVETMGARKGRSAKGGTRPPSPAVGRRASTRGSEAKGKA